jgi:hypothetical protein
MGVLNEKRCKGKNPRYDFSILPDSITRRAEIYYDKNAYVKDISVIIILVFKDNSKY